jgi:hypothetical protein
MVQLEKRGLYFETLSSSYLRKVADRFEVGNALSRFELLPAGFEMLRTSIELQGTAEA